MLKGLVDTFVMQRHIITPVDQRLSLKKGMARLFLIKNKYQRKQRLFYENLYCPKETIDVDLRALLSNAPSLIHEERENTEGQITYTEALAAVQAVKNYKSLGPDGYIPEFYQYFFQRHRKFSYSLN